VQYGPRGFGFAVLLPIATVFDERKAAVSTVSIADRPLTMQCLRSVACVVVLLMALGAVQAKITGVTGDVRLMGPGLALELPANVYAVPTDGEDDVSSPFEGDDLKIGVFDEKVSCRPTFRAVIAHA